MGGRAGLRGWGWLAAAVALAAACTLTHDVDGLSRGAATSSPTAGDAGGTASGDAGAGGSGVADAGAGGSGVADAGAGGATPEDAGAGDAAASDAAADADAAAPPCGAVGEACCPPEQSAQACSNGKAKCCWGCDPDAGFHCSCSSDAHGSADARCKLCCVVCANGFAATYGLPVPDGTSCDQVAKKECTDRGTDPDVALSGWKDVCK